jgi:hypothetical protein
MDTIQRTRTTAGEETYSDGAVGVTKLRASDVHLMRIGAVAGIVGALIGMIGNLIHPATPSGDPEGVARAIAGSDIWIADHVAIVVGLILMLGGLAAISRSIEVQDGLPHALSQLGYGAAIVGLTVGLILVSLDGIAAKHLADEWASAPAGSEKATALRLVTSEETFNFALAALFNIVFAGVTFILYGLAVAWSQMYPRWMGWVVVVAGAGSVVVGSIQAYIGESTSITRGLTIVFPTVITLWLARMGFLVLRRVSSREPV